MSDELLVSAKVPLEDGVILVEESDCWTAINIFYREGCSIEEKLPSLTKLQWEKIKRTGDYVVGKIGD